MYGRPLLSTIHERREKQSLDKDTPLKNSRKIMGKRRLMVRVCNVFYSCKKTENQRERQVNHAAVKVRPKQLCLETSLFLLIPLLQTKVFQISSSLFHARNSYLFKLIRHDIFANYR